MHSGANYKLYSDFQLGERLEPRVVQGPTVFLIETKLVMDDFFHAVTQGSGLLPSNDSASQSVHPGHQGLG